MRKLVCLVLFAVVGMAPAYAKEAPPDVAARDAEVKRYVESLVRKLKEQPDAPLGDALDVKGLLEELDRGGYLAGVPERGRKAFASGVEMGLAKKQLRELLGDPQTTNIVRIDSEGGDDRVVVLLRQVDGDGFVTRVRWYLVKRSSGWRVYDTEDLAMGLRTSTLSGAAAASLLGGDRWDAPRVINGLQTGAAALAQGDVEAAAAALAGIEDMPIPDALQAVIQILLARIDIESSAAEEALARLDRVDGLQRGLPLADLLRAEALNDLGRSEEALPVAQRYVERFEAEPMGNIQIARALIGLERSPEAVAPLLAALDDMPGDVPALAYLAQVTPADREAELAARLAKLADPPTQYELIAEYLLDVEALDALDRVTRAVAPRLPGHRDVPYYQGLVLARRGKHREAAVKLGEVLESLGPDGDDDSGRFYLDAWLESMIASGQVIEAMKKAPNKIGTFDRLVFHLKDTGDHAMRAKLLQAAEGVPGLERRLRFERADLLRAEGQYAKAVELLVPLRQEVLGQADFLEGSDFMLPYRVDDGLVRALSHLKRWDEALAIAQAHEERAESAKYLVLVHALRQEPAKAIHYIEMEYERGNDPTSLFDDPDLAGILSTAPYREIREALFEDEG